MSTEQTITANGRKAEHPPLQTIRFAYLVPRAAFMAIAVNSVAQCVRFCFVAGLVAAASTAGVAAQGTSKKFIMHSASKLSQRSTSRMTTDNPEA